MHEGVQDEWENEAKKKKMIKQNATKHRVNMTCYDEETRYRPMHDKDSKGVCKRWLCATTNAWKMHIWGKVC